MRLAAGVVIIVLSCAASSARADELVEGTVYAASKRPLAATDFPGPPDVKRHIVGAGIEWLETPPRDQSGFVLRVGAAVEHHADCPWTEPSCPFPSGGGPREVDMREYRSLLPENRVEAGAHARVGWAWSVVQLEAGVLVYSATHPTVAPVAPGGTTSVLPDIVGRFGSRATFVAAGYGTYAAPTILAPGPYLQGEVAFAERWSTTLTAGLIDVDDYRHFRFDLALRAFVTSHVGVGTGFAMTYAHRLADQSAFGGELRAQVMYAF